MEYGVDLLERPPVVEAELQDAPAAASASKNPQITVFPLMVADLIAITVNYIIRISLFK